MAKWLEMESIRFYAEDDKGAIEGVFVDGSRQRAAYPPTLDRTTGIDDAIAVSRTFKVPLMIVDRDQARRARMARTTVHEAPERSELSVKQRAVLYISQLIDPLK